MRPATPALLIVLVGGYFGIAAIGKHQNELREREQNAVISAVDDLWQQALLLGADRHRWPKVEFADDMKDLAVTLCARPNPIIRFNARTLAPYRWVVHELTVPHEMAHVMVCLDGDPEAWREAHGEAWQEQVRALLPRERAEEVLAEQGDAND